MSASAALSEAKSRDRSIAGRRAARVAKFERERLIVDYLNRGVAVAEIASRISVTEKRMRALVKEILARRMPEAPEEFAAVQASRLNEALMVAYSAMAPDNLKAVALVVRIVRELDRYHGFVGAAAGRASQGVQQDARLSTGHGARLQTAQPETRPEMAPQAVEKMESAPGDGAAPAASDNLAAASEAPQNKTGADSASQGSTPPVAAPPSFPAPATPRAAGAESAPQEFENVDSALDGNAAGAPAEEGVAARRQSCPQRRGAVPGSAAGGGGSQGSLAKGLVNGPRSPGGRRRSNAAPPRVGACR